jgi:hypothetical protein
MKKTAIMQPYLLPYIGYWQLIQSVDEFVVYDNIQYTKKGWFNRNRILQNGQDKLFTVPIKKDSDFLPVSERSLSDDSGNEVTRILRIIQANYKKAPCYSEAYPLIEKCLLYADKNLFEYIYHSIKAVCGYLDINTKITISSDVAIDHSLKAEKKVIAICKALNSDVYINSIGGTELYDKNEFQSHGIELKFIKPKEIVYEQFGVPFVPWLSIIDILMFNDKAAVKQILNEYELV